MKKYLNLSFSYDAYYGNSEYSIDIDIPLNILGLMFNCSEETIEKHFSDVIPSSYRLGEIEGKHSDVVTDLSSSIVERGPSELKLEVVNEDLEWFLNNIFDEVIENLIDEEIIEDEIPYTIIIERLSSFKKINSKNLFAELVGILQENYNNIQGKDISVTLYGIKDDKFFDELKELLKKFNVRSNL